MAMNPARRAPVQGRDVWSLAGYAAFAAILLSPLRHYVGDLKTVTAAKLDEDSFPLSTYPMFSADRKGRIVIPHVVGFTAEGERVLPHYSHFGAGGLNQVRKQVARGVRQGRAVEIAQQYADSIAAQQARRRPDSRLDTIPRREPDTASRPAAAARHERQASIATVAVVHARYVFDDYFAGATKPQAEIIHAECPVGGTAFAHPPASLPRFKKATR